MDKATLERRLAGLSGFREPRVDLEQYPTPAWLAAHLVHLADIRGDLAGRTVLDLGAGTGLIGLGVSTRSPDHVVGVERDPAALSVARVNEGTFDPPAPVAWVLGDATRPPLATERAATTVVMNPPFGAQRGHEHADRAFLAAAADLAAISYSVHNAGSRDFVASFADDRGGTVTDAYEVDLELDRQFPFHGDDRQMVDAEVFRVDWTARRKQ